MWDIQDVLKTVEMMYKYRTSHILSCTQWVLDIINYIMIMN